MDERSGQTDERETDATGDAAAAGPGSRPDLQDRRAFLRRAGQWTVGACALGGMAGALRMAAPDFWEGPPARFAVGQVADFKMRTLTFIRRHDLYVLHDEDGFGAFSARCTHLGCTVQRTGAGFVCPCHGARFDPLGHVLAGPARADLPWFRLQLKPDGLLWVDTDGSTAAGTRPRRELETAAEGERP